jgi:hypothetical protein
MIQQSESSGRPTGSTRLRHRFRAAIIVLTVAAAAASVGVWSGWIGLQPAGAPLDARSGTQTAM